MFVYFYFFKKLNVMLLNRDCFVWTVEASVIFQVYEFEMY